MKIHGSYALNLSHEELWRIYKEVDVAMSQLDPRIFPGLKDLHRSLVEHFTERIGG